MTLVRALALVVGLGLAIGHAGVWAAGEPEDGGADAMALREMFEGTSGHRETWTDVPALVVVTSVLDFAHTNVTAGYTATAETLSGAEKRQMIADLSDALVDLTNGRVPAFASVHFETPSAGQSVSVVRHGLIVAGRFLGVHARAGTLGYGVRSARRGAITAAAVILDRDFDRQSDRRRVLRTHELGHALGYNHVESQPSVMNPRVGLGLTDFDRRAIRLALRQFPDVPLAGGSVADSEDR